MGKRKNAMLNVWKFGLGVVAGVALLWAGVGWLSSGRSVPAMVFGQGMPKERGLSLSIPAPTSRPVVATSRPTSRPTSQPTSRAVTAKGNKEDADCETGCAATIKTPPLTKQLFTNYMLTFAGEPLKGGSRGLESLLFYGKKTLKMLKKHGRLSVSNNRLAFLKKELKRDRIDLHFRIIDEKSVERLSFRKVVKIGGHFHVDAQKVVGIQRAGFGGKSKRVGLHHIWVRI
jgi:hypothetical protein